MIRFGYSASVTTARIAQPGDFGIDYSGARPSPSKTKQAGGRFIIRYSAGAGNSQPATQWKLCGRNEIRDAARAGIDFIANSEWTTGRVAEGAHAGALDGAADLKFWRSRGLAKGATIYVSWDAAPVRRKWGAVDKYLREYRKALRGYYRLGCYAGTPYLRHALAKKLITHGWRPNAGSWSNDGLPYQPNLRGSRRKAMLARALKATPAAIYQTGSYWFSKGADENLLLRPAGTHLQALAAGRKHAPAKPAKPAKPVVKPAPRPAPHKGKRYPSASVQTAVALVSRDGQHGLFIENSGAVTVHHDGKVVVVLKGERP